MNCHATNYYCIFYSLVKFINEQMGIEQPEPEKVESEEAIVDNGLYVLNEKSYAKHVETGDHFIKFYAPWYVNLVINFS